MLEIEKQALRIRIAPRALGVDLCDRSGGLIVEGLRPALAGDTAATRLPRGERAHAVGEVRWV